MVVALLAAVSVVALTDGQAFAALPGEWNSWNGEIVGTGPQQQLLTTSGTLVEARNNGHLLQVWRSHDDQRVIWASLDGGDPWSLTGPNATNFSPAVTPFGTDQFAIFYTGLDNRIYMATARFSGGNRGDWSEFYPSPYGSLYNPAVTQLGAGSSSWYMVWTGFDNRVYGAYYNGSSWRSQGLGGLTYSAPAVTYNAVDRRVWAAHTGTDNRAYLQWQALGSEIWNGWYSIGGGLAGPVAFASSSTGNMVVAGRDGYGNAWFNEISAAGAPYGNWSQDTAHWASQWPLYLSVVGSAIYAILTGLDDGTVWYKQALSG